MVTWKRTVRTKKISWNVYTFKWRQHRFMSMVKHVEGWFIFTIPIHVLCYKCRMKTSSLSEHQEDKICLHRRNKGSVSRCIWLILARSAGSQMGRAQTIQHEGSRALPFLHEPAEASETVLPDGFRSNTCTVFGMPQWHSHLNDSAPNQSTLNTLSWVAV